MFMVGDFFKCDWEGKCVCEGEIFEGFDFIYDYIVSLLFLLCYVCLGLC